MPITINTNTAIWVFSESMESAISEIDYMEFIISEGPIRRLIITTNEEVRIDINKAYLNIPMRTSSGLFVHEFPPPDDTDHPSLAAITKVFTTDKLGYLEIIGFNLKDMPIIPNSVKMLVLSNTTLTNLLELPVNWNNILHLEICNNTQLNGNNIMVPEGVHVLRIQNQHCNIIRLPKTLHDLLIQFTKFEHLTGYVPLTGLCLLSNESPYTKDIIKIQQSDLCFLLSLPHLERSKFLYKRHQYIQRFILKINKDNMYNTYQEMGSIKHRIKNPIANRDNPIVAALFLGSNYLRRAAEFITEDTLI